LVSALAIGVGTMIAAGIFTLSGLAVRNVGSAAIVAFLLAAVVALFTALTYCEFASTYPETGEGYLYASKTFPPLLAYTVGWCLALGYCSSCAFYIASLSTYFHEFVWAMPPHALVALGSLVLLTALNVKGTKESGAFQVLVTAAKVALLLWFVIGGLGSVDTAELAAKFETDMLKIGATAAMVFITFFGFSAIAASAGEVKNPVKTIPRAIFISMGLVTVLYTAVVMVIIAAGLTEYTEAAMGTAAQKFLGPTGAMVIVGGALFSMISASNASIMAGSRVVMSMSQRGQLPRGVGEVNSRTRTPVMALVAVGALTGLFAVVFPLEDLAHFADTVLLLALILVNAALIYNRRKFPKLARPFRVPMVPLLPGLGIAANLYLMQQISHHYVPVGVALGSVVVGVVGYLLWSRLGATDPPSPVAERPPRVQEAEPARYRVLVPIAHPEHAAYLIGLATAIAAPRNGELLVVRVVQVPDQLVPRADDAEVAKQSEILEQARSHARELGIKATALVRVAHQIDGTILQVAREHECDLIVMGWKGFTTTRGRILGDVTDSVVRHAQCDIILAKPVGEELPKRVLLPTAGGPHARRAERYAAALVSASKGELTLCRVVSPNESSKEANRVDRDMRAAMDRVAAEDEGLEVGSKLLESDSVSGGILTASDGYDAVVLGAAHQQGVSSQLLFGTIAEQVAKNANRDVIMVKRFDPRSSSSRRAAS